MSTPPNPGTFGSVAGACTRRPKLVVGIGAIVLLLSLLGVARLKISASLEAMLGMSSPSAAALHRVTTAYQTVEAILVLVECPGEGEPTPTERAALVSYAERLTESILTDPRTRDRILWARFRQDPAYAAFTREVVLPNAPFYFGTAATRELLGRLSPARLREQFARNESLVSTPGPVGSAVSSAVLQDPLRLMELIPKHGRAIDRPVDVGEGAIQPPEFSLDGRAILVRVSARALLNDLDEAVALTRLVGQVAEETNPGSLVVRTAGPYAIADAASRTIRADAIISAVVSVALLYALFVLFYRRWVTPVLIGIAAGVGMLAGFGVCAAWSPTVSPLAAAVAALLAGLGVDYGIHFASYYDELRARGQSPRESAVATAHHMAMPITTNCFTTIIGFASLWPSRVQMLSDFARLSAAGLVGAFIAAFTLLPALLVLTDRRGSVAAAGPLRPQPARFGRLADLVAGHPRLWIASCLATLGAALAGAGVNGFVPRLEGDLGVLHPRPNAALSATDEVIARFAGQGEVMPVLLRVESCDKLVPEAFDVARALTSEECRRVGVRDVLGVQALLPDPRGENEVRDVLAAADPARLLSNFDAALEASEFDPAAYAGYRAFLAEMLHARAPPGPDVLRRYPSIFGRLFAAGPGGCPTETVLLVRLSSSFRDRLERGRIVRTLGNALSAHPHAALAGLGAVSEDLELATRRGLPQAVLLSAGLVLLWLLIVFRRMSDVLLALTPLCFAAAFTVAFMVATGQRFNPVNSIAIPLLDGIAVDAGVFLVTAARHAPGDRASLVRELRPTVHAVLLATATTLTGFASLCVAHTPAVRSLGMVAAIGIGASALGALGLLLPLLLARAGRRR